MRKIKDYLNELVMYWKYIGDYFIFLLILLEILLCDSLSGYCKKLNFETASGGKLLQLTNYFIAGVVFILFPRTILYLRLVKRRFQSILIFLSLFMITGIMVESIIKLVNFKFSNQIYKVVKENNVGFYQRDGVIDLDLNYNINGAIQLKINKNLENYNGYLDIEYKVYTGFLGLDWINKNEIIITKSRQE